MRTCGHNWLKTKKIHYWSDLDIQEFQMLSQLRSYYQQTESFLMEMEVLEKYSQYIITGTTSKIGTPTHLSEKEFKVFKYLLSNNLRLEQERIKQSDVTAILFNQFV